MSKIDLLAALWIGKGTLMQIASRLLRYVRSGPHLYLLPCLASLLTILVVLLPEANAQTPPAPCATGKRVTTYHYDNLRTGWNSQETLLTPTTVGSLQFKLLASIVPLPGTPPGNCTPGVQCLDDQIDAQPLILTNQPIQITEGPNKGTTGTQDVVYVATANNTIYAIDANAGQILTRNHLAAPVPIKSLPGTCNNNSTVLGITSTPVIDFDSSTNTAKAIYVMAYTPSGYMLYKLDPSTLLPISPSPVTVSASQTLSNGTTTYSFTAGVDRQRPALLLSQGKVYAAFGSFCDHAHNLSRGWVLGWDAATLAPVAAAFVIPNLYLTDSQATSHSTFFLSSVWMSGYGPATDETGNLFFATGNSDPSGTSFSAPGSVPAPIVTPDKLNLEMSVVKLSPDLSTVVDYFAPSNLSTLDKSDQDLGAGGVMVLPQFGAGPSLAVAAGKDGRMFLLDRTNLGQHGTSDKVVGTFSIGQCFCGQSYFTGSDGKGRIVSDGGKVIIIWRVETSPTTTLVQEHVAPQFPFQSKGSFTTISSNGSNTPIIWSVERPAKGKKLTARTLYAFDATTGAQLAAVAGAGFWSHLTANANIVPVVANGKVYVASDRTLKIFGLSPAAAPTLAPAVAAVAPNAADPPQGAGLHRVSGTVTEVHGSFPHESFTISTRTSTTLRVNPTLAARSFLDIPVSEGDNVELQGLFDPKSGVFDAMVISHAQESDAWPPDQ